MIVPLVHTLLLGSALFIAAAVTAPWFQRRQVRAIERALYAEAISMGFQAAAFASEFARRHNRGELFDDVFFAR